MTAPRGRGLRARLASWTLSVVGWRVEGRLPERERYIVVCAPHTSNWDFVLLYLAKEILQIRAGRYFGKTALFRGPWGPLFRAIGGIPVRRGSSAGIVGSAVAAFESGEDMVLALAPEGTRARKDHWRTGFYHIARQAQVPVLLTALDAERRVISIGPLFEATGDIARDFEEIARFYEGKRGIRAGQESVVAPRPSSPARGPGSTKTRTDPPSGVDSSER